MADHMHQCFDSLCQQNMAALGQIGVMINGNFGELNKAYSLAYLEGKDLISNAESQGLNAASQPGQGVGAGS